MDIKYKLSIFVVEEIFLDENRSIVAKHSYCSTCSYQIPCMGDQFFTKTFLNCSLFHKLLSAMKNQQKVKTFASTSLKLVFRLQSKSIQQDFRLSLIHTFFVYQHFILLHLSTRIPLFLFFGPILNWWSIKKAKKTHKNYCTYVVNWIVEWYFPRMCFVVQLNLCVRRAFL